MRGRSPGMGVIAEGIETETQYTTLKQLGCDRARGYLFASPLDVTTASEHLVQLSWQDTQLIARSG